jgi:hypothetical protein
VEWLLLSNPRFSSPRREKNTDQIVTSKGFDIWFYHSEAGKYNDIPKEIFQYL